MRSAAISASAITVSATATCRRVAGRLSEAEVDEIAGIIGSQHYGGEHQKEDQGGPQPDRVDLSLRPEASYGIDGDHEYGYENCGPGDVRIQAAGFKGKQRAQHGAVLFKARCADNAEGDHHNEERRVGKEGRTRWSRYK